MKFLRPELQREPELVRQFMREGRVLAKLSHPHVVQVFAMYSLEGYPCLAMEYLEGKSLSALIEEAGGKLPIERALELLQEAARGLAAAHEVGLLHRDIKPDNLIVVAGAKGRVSALKLIDFGLATNDRTGRGAPERDVTLDSDAVGGTPLFLAPELWIGRAATPQTDLYALGITFYNALTGGFPSGPVGVRGLMDYARSSDPPPSIRQVRKDVPPSLARLIERLIAKDPAHRPESASHLVTELSGLKEATRARRLPETGPFRGLLPYGESERDVFFGREAEVSQIIERLRTESALVLAGSAGSGKSSIALAGVAARVRDGALGAGFPFGVAALMPTRRPLAALESALSSALGCEAHEIEGGIAAGPQDLLELVRAKLGGSQGLLLVVDQLEALLDEPERAEEARRFADIVATFGEALLPELRVLTCLRAGALDRLVSFGGFQQLLSRGFVPVQPLGAEALSAAVDRALAVASYALDAPEPFAQALAPTTEARHSGWLVGLGLASLWSERDETSRSLKVRDWLERGGFGAALVRHADTTLQTLSEADRTRAQELLSRFVSADGHAQRVERAELLRWTDKASALLELFLDHRLVVEVAGELELLHPSLVQTWPFLREAVADQGEDRVLRERVAAAARDWESQGRPNGALWHGEQGDRLVAWFLATEARLAPLELDFVTAVRNQERRRRNLRRVGVGAIITLFAVVATWAVVGQRRLERELAALRTQFNGAAERSREATRENKLRIAELELEHDPAAALQAVHDSLALGAQPKLDVLAWRARRFGVPLALPLHPGGTGGVRTYAELVTTWGTETLQLLEIAGARRYSWKLPLAAGKPAPPTAVIQTADTLVWGNAQGELYQASTNSPEPRKLGACRGSVRRLEWYMDHLRVLCSDAAQTSFELVHADYLHFDQLRTLWSGAAAAADLSPDGARLVVASPAGLSGWADDAERVPKLELGASDRPTALASLGPDVVVGTETGKLLVVSKVGTTWKVARSAAPGGQAVRRLVADPAQRAVLSFTADGRASLYSSQLERLSEQRGASGAVHFIEGYNAVALGTASGVRVLSSIDGQTLAELAIPGGGVTGLASGNDWLFVASLDGATRAYALRPLPRRRPSPLPERQGSCSMSPDGSQLGCLSGRRLELMPMPGGGDQPQHVDLGDAQLPGSEPKLAVASRGEQVAWTCGKSELCIWDRKHDVSSRPLTGKVAWLAAAQDSGTWLVVQSAGSDTTLRVVRSSGDSYAPVPLPFVPVALSTARDGSRSFLVDATGRVLAADAPEGPYAPLPDLGMPTSSIAALPGKSRFVFGTSRGEVVLSDGHGLHRLGRLGSAVSGLATDREERALLASAENGDVQLFDLETFASFPIYGAPGGIGSAAFDPAAGVFGFMSPKGDAFRLAVDTTPVAFSHPPEDPLDPKTRPFESWRGLGSQE